VTGLPELNSRVLVAVGPESADAGRPSRVEDVEPDGALAVAAPQLSASEGVPLHGEPLMVRWSTPRGLMALPVSFLRGPVGSPSVWWVAPAGPATIDQRRHFARARVLGSVTISVGDVEVRAAVADLSEGGVRAGLRSVGELPADLEPEAPVVARVVVDGEEFVLDGWVRRLLPHGPGAEVAVEFRQPVPAQVADRLRHIVLQSQILERRASS